jgi:predicted GNAT family N-acyltransferase
MKNILEIRIIQNDNEYNDVLDIRNIVFVKEQNVPQTIEFDGLDKESVHFLVKLDSKMIGCARIRSIDGKMKLERIAILKEYRNKGFGKRLMQYLISYCDARNATEIVIHAQYYLKKFYEGLEFNPRGEPFFEAGIKHIEMYSAR